MSINGSGHALTRADERYHDSAPVELRGGARRPHPYAAAVTARMSREKYRPRRQHMQRVAHASHLRDGKVPWSAGMAGNRDWGKQPIAVSC